MKKEELAALREILEFPIGKHGITDPKEQALIRLAARGYTNAEIAEETGMTAATVAYYFRKIQNQFGISKTDITKHTFARLERFLETFEND